MRRVFNRLLMRLSRDGRFQRVLERCAIRAQFLMGIGAGSSPLTSGETVIVEGLVQHYTATQQPLCIFDVGANRGQFLGMIVQRLRHSGVPYSAHAFEPGRHAFAVLSEQFRDAPNVRLRNVGLGKENGDVTLYYDKAGSGLASLSRRELDYLDIRFDQSEAVTLTMLDDYCAKEDVETISLLKLDVEGHELDVLAGGTRMFEEQRVDMVTFEFGGCNIDTRTFFRDFWRFFHAYGMERIFRITPSGHLSRIVKYAEVEEQFRTTNYLVVSPRVRIPTTR